MNTLTLLILILVVVVLALAGFVLIQRKRRAGGVIASKPRRQRGSS
ncbi:MAG: hypothetical protein M3011_09265 [Actinomycetota bacterium]|nr:hypothetical protein [Actinomycetota bacterium]